MNLILIPIMCGILGWFIAWLFVKAIFFSWDAGFKNLIDSIEIDQFITPETSDKQFANVLPLIDSQFDIFFKHKLSEKMPMISMFIGDKTVAELKEIFIEELRLLFPHLVHQFLNNVKQNFVHNLSNKWKATLESNLLKYTRKYRVIAFFIGLIWGIITLMLTQII